MNEAERELKQRNKTIAENENVRQIVGDVRVSTWAVAIALLIGLAVLSWALLR
jgi:hypothetical protein